MGRSRKRGEARIPRMLINSLKTAFDQNRARTTTPSIHDGLQLDNCEGKETVVEILRPIFPRFSPLIIPYLPRYRVYFPRYRSFFARNAPRVDRSWVMTLCFPPSSHGRGLGLTESFRAKEQKGEITRTRHRSYCSPFLKRSAANIGAPGSGAISGHEVRRPCPCHPVITRDAATSAILAGIQFTVIIKGLRRAFRRRIGQPFG